MLSMRAVGCFFPLSGDAYMVYVIAVRLIGLFVNCVENRTKCLWVPTVMGGTHANAG